MTSFVPGTTFCLYGLGVTGQSVINYFESKKPPINYSAFDDDMSKRHFFGYQLPEKVEKSFFLENIDLVDFIIVRALINL